VEAGFSGGLQRMKLVAANVDLQLASFTKILWWYGLSAILTI